MSEDTAHTQHFEPRPVTPINGEATGPQVQQAGAEQPKQLTIEEALDQQVNRVSQLAMRVGTLIETTRDAFGEFVFESGLLFQTLQSFTRDLETRTNDNRPTDGPTTQTSA